MDTFSKPQKNGYTVFKHPANGSIIRFKFDETEPNQQFATVEVKSKAAQKERDKILNNLNFQKTGNGYERKSIGFSTHCASGNHGFLIFTSQPKPKE